MTQEKVKDCLYLVWKDPDEKKNYFVGMLCRNGNFEFSYDWQIDEALERGFEPLIAFEDINKTYVSDIIFPAFSSRLPDRKRKGIDKILRKYGLEVFDEYELLKSSGAKLPIDHLYFTTSLNNSCIEQV
jgi:hypothetical protein